MVIDYNEYLKHTPPPTCLVKFFTQTKDGGGGFLFS